MPSYNFDIRCTIEFNEILKTEMAGTPGNRTQLPGNTGDNGFEGRGEHQLLNHSQFLLVKGFWTIKNSIIYPQLLLNYAAHPFRF